ncbi:MAG: hypothetical protein JW747_08780 [Candidatus Aminicenantes bacterium]|nr:hypothetical protein [Candidatus Aminicenantes bacterium]
MKTSRADAAARERLRRRLGKFPRLPLTILPTPLHRLENLSIGPGYGFVDGSVARTLARVFREEAVILDPV